MAKKSGAVNSILSILLLITGSGLTFWGYKQSEGFTSRVSNLLTGSHSDNVMLLFISGSLCIALGIYVFFRR